MERGEWRLMGWIAVAQVMGLVLGWAALGVVMKVVGYPQPESVLFIRWHPWAIPLREQGPWFLLVTAVWSAALFVVGWFRWPVVLKTLSAVGMALAFVIPGLFLYSLMNLYTRPLLTSTGPVASSTAVTPQSAPAQK